VEEACLYATISRNTFYEFTKHHPDFQDRIAALRNAPILMARMCVLRAAEHDADLALKYLERKLPMEFSTRAQMHHTSDAVDRHFVDPEQIALIKKAMGNWVIGRQKAEQSV
jgi:tRNA(Ile2) C34 agmatinyltransferase TiaS